MFIFLNFYVFFKLSESFLHEESDNDLCKMWRLKDKETLTVLNIEPEIRAWLKLRKALVAFAEVLACNKSDWRSIQQRVTQAVTNAGAMNGVASSPFSIAPFVFEVEVEEEVKFSADDSLGSCDREKCWRARKRLLKAPRRVTAAVMDKPALQRGPPIKRILETTGCSACNYKLSAIIRYRPATLS